MIELKVNFITRLMLLSLRVIQRYWVNYYGLQSDSNNWDA